MISFKTRLKETIYERLKGVYPVAIEDLDMAPTPDPKMGDLALTFPFQLAKTLKKAPRAIAQEAAPLLGSVAGVVRTEVAVRPSLVPEEDKIIIEHTNINPNKAAHIGHLRGCGEAGCFGSRPGA
jgi:arginyl-tRNA synthetase